MKWAEVKGFAARVARSGNVAYRAARAEWLVSSPPSPCDTCLANTAHVALVGRFRLVRRCYACQDAAMRVISERVYRKIMADLFAPDDK
jgi:hypothetical protein